MAESDSVIPADTKVELASLRSQLIDLRTFSEQSQADSQTVERRMAVIQADYEGRLHERELDSSGRIRELEDELVRLDESLETAHHQLSETVVENKHLNHQLTAALKLTAGGGGNGSAGESPRGSSDTTRNQNQDPSYVQMRTKVEWLKRENAGLEERCRQAEEKVSILLGLSFVFPSFVIWFEPFLTWSLFSCCFASDHMEEGEEASPIVDDRDRYDNAPSPAVPTIQRFGGPPPAR